MEETEEERAFRADGLGKQRVTALLSAALCAGGGVAWFFIVWAPIVSERETDLLRTRVAWFGSVALGWVFNIGITMLLLGGVMRYGLKVRALSHEIRALRTSADSVPRARIHRTP